MGYPVCVDRYDIAQFLAYFESDQVKLQRHYSRRKDFHHGAH